MVGGERCVVLGMTVFGGHHKFVLARVSEFLNNGYDVISVDYSKRASRKKVILQVHNDECCHGDLVCGEVEVS